MSKTPQQIYLLKQWDGFMEDCYILRAFRDRMDAEKYIDHQVDALWKLAKEDPELFESETGFSPEFFEFFEEDDLDFMLGRIRNLFHLEKVDLY